MRTVMTVTGEVGVDALGHTQCHEHLLISPGVGGEMNSALCMDDVDKSTEEVAHYVRAGGKTVIDAQPGGCNRMEKELAEIARCTDTHIVASTGFHKMLFYPEDHWVFRESALRLEEFFYDELTESMKEDIDKEWPGRPTESRAGIVKMALDTDFNARYQKLFEAGISAAKAADRPMMIHIEKGSDPAMLVDFLDRRDALKHVIFCHMDRTVKDLSIHRYVAEAGIYLDYDTVGRFKYHDDDEEIDRIEGAWREGYGEKILLSLDTTRLRLRTYTPDAIGLDYILTTFIPHLKRRGFPESAIVAMTRGNITQVL